MASSQPLLRLLCYGKSYRIKIWGAIICSIFRTLFDLAKSKAIALCEVRKNQKFNLTDNRNSNPVCFLQQLNQPSVSLQKRYNRVGIELELAYFEDRSTGTLLSVLNDDINQLERFLNFGAIDLIDFFTRVLAVGISFIILAPAIAWSAMLPIPFILWGTFIFQAKLEPRYADVRERAGSIGARLANNISGIATIKSFTTEAYEQERVTIESEAYRRSNAKAIALSTMFQPLLRFLILLGFIIILYFGGLEVLGDRLSVGTYGFMVFIVQDLLWPFTELSEIMDEYQRAMASVRRVMGLLDTPIVIAHGDRSLPLHTVRGEVQFEDVTFAYNGRNSVLQQLSLHIPAQATIGIVGATGSGKSTLVKLLLRFYEVEKGSILLDGINIKDYNLYELRRAIAWVSQDVFLFHGTVAENIRYGSFNSTHKQIIDAAKLAEAHEFIEELPQGYDTIVGERGQKLSGGQRQRLAIARAILKNPPILILDEATSAVDNETEAAIQKSLTKITQNRTTIAIAHRLSTIRHSDRIYVMDKGQIVEGGTHEELLSLDGIYARLWRVQSGVLS